MKRGLVLLVILISPLILAGLAHAAVNQVTLYAGASGVDDGATASGATWYLRLNTTGGVVENIKYNFTSLGGALAANDDFGESVAAIGDIDGDGVDDLAVGAPDTEQDLGVDVGAVWILFMNADATIRAKQQISNFSGQLNTQMKANDDFGKSVAGLGDLNGDGVRDIVVGAVGDDDGASGRGALYVLFLNTSGNVTGYQKISELHGNFNETIQNNLFSNTGSSLQFGTTIANIGDLDGDGITDLAVGAPNDDDDTSNEGTVWILFMNSTGNVSRTQKINDLHGGFTPALDGNDFFGRSVTNLGDLDNDGVTDLAVGANGDDDAASAAGAAWILFMRSNGSVQSQVKINITSGNFSGTLNSGDAFGWGIAALGDVDNDNIEDLAVSARLDDSPASSAGTVHILFLSESGAVKRSLNISEGTNGFTGIVAGSDFLGFGLAASTAGSRIVSDASGISGGGFLSVKVNGNASGLNDKTYTGIQSLELFDDANILFNISWNASAGGYDLSRLTVDLASTGIAINDSGQGVQKELYLYGSYLSICVKDAQINSVSAISSDCTGQNETKFGSPSTNCPTTIDGITCTPVSGGFQFSGLSHSGAQGQPVPVPEFTDFALMAALLGAFLGIAVLRKR